MGFWDSFPFKSVPKFWPVILVTTTDVWISGYRLRDPFDRYIHAGPSIFTNTRLQAKSFVQVRRLWLSLVDWSDDK
jgi:hypothetical protein